MKEHEALKLALEALERIAYFKLQPDTIQNLTDHYSIAIKEVLAQPEQEPVAWGWIDCGKLIGALDYKRHPDYITPLYTTPPQRKPLTDEQMDAVIDKCPKYHGRFSTTDPSGKLNYYELIRAIEAAHGIKE